jgi:UPF0716 protein FxsA
MVKWTIIAILLLPVAEIATFMLAAALIGVGWAFALMVATSIWGFLVLQRAGHGRRERFRAAVTEGNMAEIEGHTGSFLIVLGALLLLLPGFLTDLAGAALLIGPIRRRFAATFRRSVMGSGNSGGGGRVIDLGPDEWTQIPDPPRRRRKPRR